MTKAIDLHGTRPSATTVTITPPNIVRRRVAEWTGIQGDSFEITRLERFEYAVTSPFHLLIVSERAERSEGETVVEGHQKATLREFNRKLSFIPAGRRFLGWQDPRVLSRFAYLHIDPAGPLVDPDLRFSEIEFKPRLFFFDRDLWETAFKLKMQIENPTSSGYAEALGLVLAHELVRLHAGPPAQMLRGGLAGWQKKRVSDYIEDHLNDEMPLQELAAVAKLSTYHFARAFKQSFGVPPHRYHMSRRMERAKALLDVPARTVTDVGLMLGFAETSSFTSAFRRSVGITPTDYRRRIM
jgi:AraC family transcriptional regulator